MWADRPHTVLLQGGWDERGLGRFSILGFDPCAVIEGKGNLVWVHGAHGKQPITIDVFDYLERWYEPLRRHPLQAAVDAPFQGGAIGYFAYDLWARPSVGSNDPGLPDVYLPVFDVFAVYDHLKSKTLLWSTEIGRLGEGIGGADKSAAARMDETLDQLKRALERRCGDKARFRSQGNVESDGRMLSDTVQSEQLMSENNSSFRKEQYLKAIQTVKDLISRGEVFQVNLAQRFCVPFTGDPVDLFQRLHRVNPAPFGAFINGGAWQIISISPERGFKFDGRMIETRPIKGTRPRGKTEAQDEALKRELMSSEKDRAEHIMIVDQERDDLSRLCRVGSVKVPELMVCEGHPGVWHLVSTVVGELENPARIIPCLHEFFPSGSITGAPKQKVMEIIADLEPVNRGVYTGAIGYLGVGGQIDLNIAIRTMTIVDGRAYFHVGGGIVSDSDPEAEYRETIEKGRSIAYALSSSVGGNT